MKILLLAEANSPHTIKWVTSLAKRNTEILLFSITDCLTQQYNKFDNVTVESGGIRFNQLWTETRYSKMIYLKLLPQVKKLVDAFKPDLLHAHYATSYGFLAGLSNFQPLLVSVWGSDVLSFPNKSFIHKYILKFVFKKAQRIFATSRFLANETGNYTDKLITIISFGVDLDQFEARESKKYFKDDDTVVGTVKSLEKIYGIDTLIKSFGIVKKRNPDLPLKLLIVGSGSEEKRLKTLAADRLEESDYFFAGNISHDDIQAFHSMIDISVYLSLQESFGVSILEAMASSKPVVVSNAGGLLEIVDDGENGCIVSPNNPEEAAFAIEKLVRYPELRTKFGTNGREKIRRTYDWNACVDKMMENYSEVLKNNQNNKR